MLNSAVAGCDGREKNEKKRYHCIVTACQMKQNEVTVESRSPDETIAIGKIVGLTLQGSDVVALVGDLGAGKTCLTQGIAQGLDVPVNYYVTSPTFTLVNEYPGRIPLYHMDVYRLSDAGDVGDLGYEEYLNGDGVVVIEWAEKIEEVVPATALFVNIEHRDDNERKITFAGLSDKIDVLRNKLSEGGFA